MDVETLVTRLAARWTGVTLDESDDDARPVFVPPDAPRHFETAEAPQWTEPALPFSDTDAARRLLAAIGPGREVTDGRPIVFAAPEPDTLEALAAATLAIDAAWALEPMAEAFVATACWVRPTILVAPPRALDALATAWDDSDRKWSRLQVVVARVSGIREEDVATDPWRAAFGCRVGVWNQPA